MACENCNNGCVNPQLCACDCASCAEANSCDIPVGDQGPVGPAGPQGLPGVNGTNGINGIDGIDGCSLTDIYISDGTDGNLNGDVIVTTAPAPTPCNQVINAGNIVDAIIQSGSNIPPGVICMWSGFIANIPAGWELCDGSGTTPDLGERFVMGYKVGSPTAGGQGNTGGNLTMQLQPPHIPAHTHSVGSYTVGVTIDNSGAHRHTVQGKRNTGSGTIQSLRRTDGNVGMVGITNFRTGLTSGSPTTGSDEGNHTHTATSSLTGQSGDGTPLLNAPVGNPFNLLNPYFVLAFIIKT